MSAVFPPFHWAPTIRFTFGVPEWSDRWVLTDSRGQQVFFEDAGGYGRSGASVERKGPAPTRPLPAWAVRGAR